MSNGTLSTQRTLSHFFSESWISKVLDIIDFSKSSLFIHFGRTSESAWMKMHLLCSDEKAWSQRPLDGVRAGQRNGHIFLPFSCFRNKNAMRIWRVYDKMTWTYIFITGCDSCTGMWSPILANDVSCTVIWPWCPDRAFIKAIEGGTPLFSEYSSSQHWSLVVVGLTDFSRAFFFLENISYIVWDIRNREREKKVLTNFIYIFHCRAPCQ